MPYEKKKKILNTDIPNTRMVIMQRWRGRDDFLRERRGKDFLDSSISPLLFIP